VAGHRPLNVALPIRLRTDEARTNPFKLAPHSRSAAVRPPRLGSTLGERRPHLGRPGVANTIDYKGVAPKTRDSA